jgi:hypothetical protein
MQHLAHARHSASLPEAILAEVGAQTIVGCFNATNELVESLAEFLIAKLDDAGVARIAPPERKWTLEAAGSGEFSGFAPAPLGREFVDGVINPRDEERINLATELGALERDLDRPPEG